MSWIEFNKSYKEFSELNRNVPGALIEVLHNSKRKIYLIGDINTASSCSKGDKLFDDGDVVLKYKYVWSR